MRSRFALLAACAASLAASTAAYSQSADYPNRQIKVIVPYAAGGADIYIRPLTDNLEKKNISLIITSQVGAGGIIGSNAVKRSEPDGYTLLFAGSGAMTTAPKFQKAEYTLADFQPITQIISIPFILTVPKAAPYKNLKEFIDYAKKNPGKINVGTPGIGSTPHLALKILEEQAGFAVTNVPFSGVAPAIVALMGNHVDAVFGAPSSIMPHINSGELIALGISDTTRFKPTPDIPTFTEQGFDVVVVSTFGFLAPKGVPQSIVAKLNDAFKDVAADKVYEANMAKLYNEVKLLGPEEYLKDLQRQDSVFGKVIGKLPKQ